MWNLELEIAREAALAAGEITESLFGCGHETGEVRDKAPGHPVTDADQHADLVIRQLIMDSFPADGWLSEETADSKERLTRRRVWIVDPIDGTKEFIAGIPEYVISIGLVEDGIPVLGVIYQPTNRILYWGTRQDGAFCGEQRLSVKDTNSERPRVFVSRSETAKGLWKPYSDRVVIEPCGSIAYKIARVANGEADGVITLNPRSEWDIAGAAAILYAAGGRLCDSTGQPVLFNREDPRTDSGIIGGAASFVTRGLALLKS